MLVLDHFYEFGQGLVVVRGCATDDFKEDAAETPNIRREGVDPVFLEELWCHVKGGPLLVRRAVLFLRIHKVGCFSGYPKITEFELAVLVDEDR